MVHVTSRKRKADTSFPTAQQVLNLAASKYLKTIDPSKPEDLNGFVYYMEKVRKTLLVDTKSGSLIITVECRSLEILDGLWSDYCTGFLNKMVQKFLVTDEVLKELGITEVKLTTTILEEEYRACRESLLQHSGEFRSLYLLVYCSYTFYPLKTTKMVSVLLKFFLISMDHFDDVDISAISTIFRSFHMNTEDATSV